MILLSLISEVLNIYFDFCVFRTKNHLQENLKRVFMRGVLPLFCLLISPYAQIILSDQAEQFLLYSCGPMCLRIIYVVLPIYIFCKTTCPRKPIKIIFSREVCALNFEAMSLLSSEEVANQAASMNPDLTQSYSFLTLHLQALKP